MSIDDSNRATVPSQIAELVRSEVTSGALRPGNRMPSERDLAEIMGVGRSAVREALRELRAQGFLESGRGRRGTTVASLADVGIGEPLAQLLNAGTGQFLDLIELRLGLEVQAVALAARRRMPEDLEALEKILALMGGRAEKQRSADLDAAFHGTIAEATHNVFYMHVTSELVHLLKENIPAILEILYTDPHSARDLLAQHRGIVAAVRSRDEESARGAMTDHLQYVVEGLRRLEQQVAIEGSSVGFLAKPDARPSSKAKNDGRSGRS